MTLFNMNDVDVMGTLNKLLYLFFIMINCKKKGIGPRVYMDTGSSELRRHRFLKFCYYLEFESDGTSFVFENDFEF